MGAALVATPHPTGAGAAPGSPERPAPPRPEAGRRWLPPYLVRLLRGSLVLAGLVVTVSFAGIELATPGGSGYSQDLDSRVATWMASHQDGITTAFGRAVQLASGMPAMLVVAIAAGVVLVRWTGRRSLGFGPVAALAATVAVTHAIAVAVARPGPGGDVANGSALGSSFPSAQAASVVAVLLATGLIASRAAARRPAPAHVVGLFAALTVVAGSSLVVGSHWLSDVVAGVVVGTVVAIVVAGVTDPCRSRTRSRWAITRRALVLGLAMAAIPVGTSYLEALSYPGQAATSVRTVDWLRNGGLGGPVDRAEAWWLWHHLPAGGTVFALQPLPASHGAEPAEHAPATTSPATKSDGGGMVPSGSRPAPIDPPPTPVAPVLSPPLPGEGQWTVIDARPDGGPTVAATRVRPDPAHPELVATVAWMDPAALRFALVAGTREPGGGPGPWDAHVPADLQPGLLAAFNSGFKMKDTPGGALEEGHQVRALVDGLATLVVRADGTATVGAWGRDVKPGPDVVAARQNLRLIVDGGQPVPGLTENDGRWGPLSQAAPAWRSGLGVDAFGHVVYASGNHLTLDVLADLLRRAGAVRAMELDIHSQMVVFDLFSHPQGALRPVGQKLSPDMVPSANRYLTPDQRDFVAVFAR